MVAQQPRPNPRRRAIVAGMVKTTAVLFLLFAAAAAPAQAGEIEWHTDFDAARALAKDRGAPLLAVFRCER